MADKVFISINASKINFDCPHYRQNSTTGNRWCVYEKNVDKIGKVNDGAERKARISSCSGCECYGLNAPRYEKYLSKEAIKKIRAGNVEIIKVEEKKEVKKVKVKKDLFAMPKDKGNEKKETNNDESQ